MPLFQQRLLRHNGQLAAANRRCFQPLAELGLNLVSSPGSAKAGVLVRLAQAWRFLGALAVLVGDLASDLVRHAADDLAEILGVLSLAIGSGAGHAAPRSGDGPRRRCGAEHRK